MIVVGDAPGELVFHFAHVGSEYSFGTTCRRYFEDDEGVLRFMDKLIVVLRITYIIHENEYLRMKTEEFGMIRLEIY